MIDRLRRIAIRLGMTPTSGIRIEIDDADRWIMSGCLEEDQPLPMTAGAETVCEALTSVEIWLGLD